MNVAIIGSGGREHALAYKISESPILSNLFIIPGNPGTSKCGTNIILSLDDFKSIDNFCKDKEIDLVVVGPEAPLVAGLSDYLRGIGVAVFGPSSSAARIESEKSFAKKIMVENGISTAQYREFTSDEYGEAKKYLQEKTYPCVLKADGLAAGKGVLICEDMKTALKGLDELFLQNKYGRAGNKIIVEDFLTGEEASIFAITDGENFICLPSSQDHKRIGENDTGLNTGGMGAYSPAPVVSDKILEEIKTKIIKPVLTAMRESGNKFVGCLYAGLMITNEGTKVIEFNCRFGDPETQAVLPLLGGDFLKLLYSAANGNLDKEAVTYNGGCSICVVASSKGYPEEYINGYEIKGLNNINCPSVIVYHAGTKQDKGKILTNGGRVFGVTAFSLNKDYKFVKNIVYQNLSKISFEGMYYRRDIAHMVLKK
ncbi:MAG: phosphoribosylamine--glycine ligase [Bacteroidetes bacterium]|nr:phosphoribosylamine--glycine ligase [Bacteroidota bacterium]MCH8326665.1 phosphoribosylamine--glycine ligase [Bacteroidota bacterium]